MGSSTCTPVFVVGSARSGTTLLTRVLFSSTAFHSYEAETLLLSVCKPKYGNIFNSSARRAKFLTDWLKSRQFKRSNLSEKEFVSLIDSSETYEQLLIRFLETMGKKAKKHFIIDSTPAHSKHIPSIQRECQSAIFIAIVRDGRDVAISQNKLNWSNPPPPFTTTESKLHYSVVQWLETQKEIDKASHRTDIISVRYEDLATRPESVISIIAKRLELPLSSFDLGLVTSGAGANSAFGCLSPSASKSPLNRWKALDPSTCRNISYGANSTLKRFGYETNGEQLALRLMFRYEAFLLHIKLKRFLTQRPLFGKLISSSLEL